MRKDIHLGIILNSIPTYSETFLISKLNGLVSEGFKISLFIFSKNKSNIYLDRSINIYWQDNVYKLRFLIISMLKVIILAPYKLIKFILIERSSNRGWVRIIKNIIINANILVVKNLDWIHFEFATIGISRENIGKAVGAKIACSFRGFDICLFPYRNPKCYDLLFKSIDKVHTISDDLYKHALKLGLEKSVKFQKITPAINTNMFSNEKATGKLHSPIRILTVSRLHWKKGIEYAIDALKIVNQKGLEFEYRIIESGDYYEPIVYAINSSGIAEKIKMVGEKNHFDIVNEMKWADIYIQPSIQEGFCNAVIEAQAMKLLVIVTDADGLSENVLNNKTGWVVPKRNAISISDRIIDISSMNQKKIKIVQDNARKRVMNNFSITKQIEMFSDFYKNI